MGSVEGPLAGIPVSCCGSCLCVPPGGGICEEPRIMYVLVSRSMVSHDPRVESGSLHPALRPPCRIHASRKPSLTAPVQSIHFLSLMV